MGRGFLKVNMNYKCKHKKAGWDLFVVQTDHIQSGIGHICQKCGAVRDSVDMDAKWQIPYDAKHKDLLLRALAEKFGYRYEDCKII